MRLEFPVGPGVRDGKPLSGRVIDRGGVATQVPVSVAERTEEVTGQRWITADVSLAALSPGDYAIEVVIRTGVQRGTRAHTDSRRHVSFQRAHTAQDGA